MPLSSALCIESNSTGGKAIWCEKNFLDKIFSHSTFQEALPSDNFRDNGLDLGLGGLLLLLTREKKNFKKAIGTMTN